tara:strand:- start:116 stop:295 length:180 start_codon:yes stop_codon:yes gene_type:complete
MTKEVKNIRDILSKTTGDKIGYWTKDNGKDVLVSTMPDPVVSIKVYEIDENGKRVLVDG